MSEVEPAAPTLRILLVEDDEFDVAVFGRAFRRGAISCEIVRCRSGEEVLEGLAATELEFDLLVTDHQLPGLSGFDLCLQVINKYRSQPPFALVLLTGVGSEQMAIKALRAGIHDYIVKDASREYLELLALVLPKVARRHRRRRSRQLERPTRPAPLAVRETLAPDAVLELEACADLIRDRGGRIWIENAAGGAPELHFRVPLAPEEVPHWTAETSGSRKADGEPTAAAADDDADQPSPPASSQHVLVAHPNPIVAFVARRAIERSGYRCAVVGSAEGAIEALDREPFDLVLLGLEMPQLDGFKATRRIRRREAESGGRVRIFGLGAAADVAKRCIEAGMDGSVASPVSARGVRATFTELG